MRALFLALFSLVSSIAPSFWSADALAAQQAAVRQTEIAGFSAGQIALALGLLALLLFIALKLLGHARRKKSVRNTAKGAGRPASPAPPAPKAPSAPAAPGNDPAPFRPEEAEQLFRRLQEAWDVRDLESVDALTTPAMAAQVRAQAEEDPEPSRTAILRLKADILKIDEQDGKARAEVYFTILLREEERGGEVQEEREVWLFFREAPGAPWLLDAIHHVKA